MTFSSRIGVRLGTCASGFVKNFSQMTSPGSIASSTKEKRNIPLNINLNPHHLSSQAYRMCLTCKTVFNDVTTNGNFLPTKTACPNDESFECKIEYVNPKEIENKPRSNTDLNKVSRTATNAIVNANAVIADYWSKQYD